MREAGFRALTSHICLKLPEICCALDRSGDDLADLGLLGLVVQGLGWAADLRRNRHNHLPTRPVLPFTILLPVPWMRGIGSFVRELALRAARGKRPLRALFTDFLHCNECPLPREGQKPRPCPEIALAGPASVLMARFQNQKTERLDGL